MADLLRLAVLGVVIYFLYQYFGGGRPISNSGSVVMSPTLSVPVHITENEQIENAPGGTLATGSDAYACGVAPQPYSTLSSTEKNFIQQNENVLPYPQISNNYVPQAEFNQQQVTSCDPNDPNYFSNQVLMAQDLLPKDNGYNTWNEASPQSQGNLSDQNFLASGHHFGINTVGQSLKNANKQLRSDPPIPQVSVGPWSQSTISADTNRLTFEIGSC